MMNENHFPIMTASKLILAGFCGFAALVAPVSVADTVAGTPDASVQYYSANKVGDALASLPLLGDAKPNTSARYYFYLCSAGWCGPCNMEMPHVVKVYEEMKKSGLVELVLVDFDRSEADAKAFMAKYGVNFPATMSQNGGMLPGLTPPRGIPAAALVDAEGNVIKMGHGSIVQRWKALISAYEKEKELPLSFPEQMTLRFESQRMLADVDTDDASASAEEGASANVVADAMSNIAWFNGKPSKKAKYYIYLQSASWCGPCRAEMPDIAKEYKAMKRDGRVELVLLSGDRNLKAAKAFLKDNKAKFPGTMGSEAAVRALPGVNKLPNYFPAAAIVKADGTVIAANHGSIVAKWREYTIDAEE